MTSENSILNGVRSPADLRLLQESELAPLAAELRQEVIRAVSRTGGHLGAGLGVVELTIALHYVFNTPDDRLIWDVGHQCYPHKILTERRDRMDSLRKGGGLSGFTKRAESLYDPFGAGHSSTSISAGLGMAVARDLKGGDNNIIAVIGDGAMTAGMAWEAMNNAGAMRSRLTVVLNDNDMSIDRPVGAMSAYLSRLLSSRPWLTLREAARRLATRFPDGMERAAARAEEFARSLMTGGTLFEELGFYYIGPVDGHDLNHLLPVLRNVRDARDPRPFLVHVVTRKGKGYAPAEKSDDKYHGVGKFDMATGALQPPAGGPPTYTRVFGETLARLADADDRIVAVSAAMPSGTGVNIFAEKHPRRAFDVGIAEQHAVTFAAGLAAEGMRPFAAIYSTFLQRAYDQVVHDVAVQKLPVRFAIDRAGYVGADGQTHCGAFDLAFLGCLPDFLLMAPADEAELARMTATAALYDDGPCAFRYPRGAGVGVEIPDAPEPLEIGKGRVLREGTRAAILSIGTRLADSLAAAEMLEAEGVSVTVADARFAKPLDTELLLRLARGHEALVVVEEGSIGGFAAAVTDFLVRRDLTRRLKLRTLFMPDMFLDQDTPENQIARAALDAPAIAAALRDALRNSG